MSTAPRTRLRTATSADRRRGHTVVMMTLSATDIDVWLRDDERRLRSLAGRGRLRAAERDELRVALAQLDHAVAVLDRLALELESGSGPHDADPETIGWLHTRTSALAGALTAAVERGALDRAA